MITFNLYQTAVYWAPVAPDNYGRPAFADPVELTVRWEDTITETIAPDHTVVLSGSTVYTDTPVVVGGLMYLGSESDVAGVDNPRTVGREIINVGTVPSLKNDQSLVTIKLR